MLERFHLEMNDVGKVRCGDVRFWQASMCRCVMLTSFDMEVSDFGRVRVRM